MTMTLEIAVRITGVFKPGRGAWASRGELAPDNPPESDEIEDIQASVCGVAVDLDKLPITFEAIEEALIERAKEQEGEHENSD